MLATVTHAQQTLCTLPNTCCLTTQQLLTNSSTRKSYDETAAAITFALLKKKYIQFMKKLAGTGDWHWYTSGTNCNTHWPLTSLLAIPVSGQSVILLTMSWSAASNLVTWTPVSTLGYFHQISVHIAFSDIATTSILTSKTISQDWPMSMLSKMFTQ